MTKIVYVCIVYQNGLVYILIKICFDDFCRKKLEILEGKKYLNRFCKLKAAQFNNRICFNISTCLDISLKEALFTWILGQLGKIRLKLM